jgi:DNA-binding transcriptional LysR family regulator
MMEVAYIFGLPCRGKWNAVLDIEDLQTFVEVADAGGVSAAARRLGVSKSIVSRRLFRLESELGVQLLARTTRGAALTEAGVTFRDHAAKVCAELDIARETILPAGDLHGPVAHRCPAFIRPHLFSPGPRRVGEETSVAPCARVLQ